MATGVKSWSSTAGDNDNADANINWLENQAPSTVNNSARAMMAAIRDWYIDTEWRDWGHTVAYVSATTFTIAADVTALYVEGRAIRCEDSSTLYGHVVSSSFSSPNTTITVVLDSGSLSASLTSVALGPDVTNPSVSVAAIKWNKGADVASAAALDVPKTGNYFDVTGTTSITSINTMGLGTVIKLQFDGALTLTNHATNLILPSGANITTAAGDHAEFVEYGSGTWRCTNYERADGTALVNNPTASGGSSVVYLATQTASASATVDFTSSIDSTYDEYIIKFVNVIPATDGDHLYMRVSVSSTFQTAATDYEYYHDGGNRGGVVNGTAQDAFMKINSGMGSAAGENCTGWVRFWTPANTSNFTNFEWGTTYQNFTSGYTTKLHGGGSYHGAVSAIDGVRFYCHTGNTASGTFRLYGIKNS